MDFLKRNLAPILPAAWSEIDNEAADILRDSLAGRKLVDFDGPHGWQFAAVPTGRLHAIEPPASGGVSAALRRVQPLVELTVPIHLSIAELDLVARGARDIDLEPVTHAAQQIARAEDSAIFNGLSSAGIAGMVPSSPHEPIQLDGVVDYPRAVLDAREVLRKSGISGSFALALGTNAYEDLMASTEDGYPVAKQVQKALDDGKILHAPSLEGAVLLSTRGGDYVLTIGQDLSVGYAHHDREHVDLYITETLSFRVLEPRAAVPLAQT